MGGVDISFSLSLPLPPFLLVVFIAVIHYSERIHNKINRDMAHGAALGVTVPRVSSWKSHRTRSAPPVTAMIMHAKC